MRRRRPGGSACSSTSWKPQGMNNLPDSSLRGAKRRERSWPAGPTNPGRCGTALDCFASLAMTSGCRFVGQSAVCLPRARAAANRAATMDYVSTRGSAPALDFEGVTLAGLASDGGLYLPREWPRFSEAEIGSMAGLTYVELAVRVMQPFVGDSLTGDRLRELADEACGRFAHGAGTPLEEVDE